MNKKILIVLGAVFALLIAAATAPYWLGGLKKSVGVGGPAPAAPISLTGFSEDAATKVVIVGHGQTVTLEKKDGNWTVVAVPPPEPVPPAKSAKTTAKTAKRATPAAKEAVSQAKPAKADAVKEFFAVLAGTSVGNLVAKNPDNHAPLGVTEQDGYVVSLEQGERKLGLIVGDSAFGESFYLRLKDSGDVYLASGNLRQSVSRPAASWEEVPAEETAADKTTSAGGKKAPNAI